MNEARKALEKEVDILEMIKSRRFIHMALRHLLDPALHKELEARSKFVEIDTNHETVKLEQDNDLTREVREEQARVNDNNSPVSEIILR